MKANKKPPGIASTEGLLFAIKSNALGDELETGLG